MNNLNSILLEGELVGNPGYQSDKQGNPVCRFTLASSRFFKTGNGIEKETGYFDIKAAGKLASYCKNNGHEGRGVRIVGRLKQEHSLNAEGQTVARIVIEAEHVEFRPTWSQQQKQPVHTHDDYDMGR
jgi:single-strand DNA-binding protein